MIIGFWRSWALVVGMMVGSGIFTLPAILAPYGSYSFLAWAITVVGALSLVFSMSYMAARNPRAGGPQAYVLEAFGQGPAVVVAWGYWVSLVVAVAAIALSFAGYLAVFVPVIATNPVFSSLTALGIVWLFTAVCLWGTQQASLLQLWTTILKIIPLLLLGFAGLSMGDLSNIEPARPNNESFVTMIAGIMLLIMWSYIGIEAASIPSDETKDPKKTIPLALFWGTVTATAVYVLALAGVMALIPLDQLASSTHPFADAANLVFGSWGASLVGIGALISIGGALNACVFLTGSIPHAGAKDGLFPKALVQSQGRDSSRNALLMSSGIASLLILMNASKGLLGSFEFMILISTFSVLIVYFGAALAGIKLHSVDKANGREVSPLTLFCSVLGLLFSSAAIYGAWTLYQ